MSFLRKIDKLKLLQIWKTDKLCQNAKNEQNIFPTEISGRWDGWTVKNQPSESFDHILYSPLL